MWNFLLDTYSSGVVDNPSSGASTPDYIVGTQIDNGSLFLGIIIGLFISLCIWGIVTVAKLLLTDNQNQKQEKNSTKKSDE